MRNQQVEMAIRSCWLELQNCTYFSKCRGGDVYFIIIIIIIL